MRVVCAALHIIVLSSCGRVAFDGLDAGDGAPRDAAEGGALDVGTIDAASDATSADTGARDGGLDATPDTSADADGGAPEDAGPDVAVDAGDAAMCSESPCRLLSPQCGCPIGEMCVRPDPADAARACRPAGASSAGDSCMSPDDCAPGLACVFDAGSVGHCEPYCDTSGLCGIHQCITLPVASEPIGTCSPDCAPSTGGGCASGLTCAHLLTESIPTRDFVWARGCVAGPLPTTGEPCPAGVCGPSLACVSGVCERLCDVPGGLCLVGMTCTSLSPRLLVPGTGRELGVCR